MDMAQEKPSDNIGQGKGIHNCILLHSIEELMGKSGFTATAAMGLNLGHHEIRRFNTKEYHHLTDLTVLSKKLRENKKEAGIAAIETAIPSAKTARNSSFWRLANHMLANVNTLFSLYNFRTTKGCFNPYQERQRAPEMMVNMLSESGTKYSRRRRSKKKRNKKSK